MFNHQCLTTKKQTKRTILLGFDEGSWDGSREMDGAMDGFAVGAFVGRGVETDQALEMLAMKRARARLSFIVMMLMVASRSQAVESVGQFQLRFEGV
jgi:hypothetical protein